MTDFTCTLGPVSFEVMPGADFGQVLQGLDFGSTARADVPRLAVVRGDVPRTFSFPALIEAASKDAAIAVVSAANKALSVSNTLIVHSKDATKSVTFRTFPSGSVHQAPVKEWEARNKQAVQVTVTIEPYAYGSTITDAHANTALPGAIPLSAMTGEYAAPLTVEVAPHTAGEKLHSVYMALNEHTDWDGWITAASGLTWTNMSAAVVDTTAYGGYHKYTSGTSIAVCNFDTTGVPPGDYLVLVRAKVTSGNPSTAATVDIAGATRWTVTIPADTTAVPTDIWRYYEVAQLALPYSLVRGSGTSTMPINVRCNHASQHVYLDQVVLLPIGSGFQAWHPALDNSTYWKADTYFADDGAVYLDGVCDLTKVTGSPIKSLSGEIVMLVDEKDGNQPHTHCDVTLLQTPRYSLYA